MSAADRIVRYALRSQRLSSIRARLQGGKSSEWRHGHTEGLLDAAMATQQPIDPLLWRAATNEIDFLRQREIEAMTREFLDDEVAL